MKILGLAAPFGHDPSAALLIDGKVVAAVEEERLIRKKHATDRRPIEAVRYCLKEAGIRASEIDRVAFPWSLDALREKRWAYLQRTLFSNPSRAYKKFFRNNKEFAGQKRFVQETLAGCGFDPAACKIDWIEHHLAHAASSFYFSGFSEAAVLSIDGGGEITSTLLACAQNGAIKKIKEIVAPDSLGNFYSTLTDYLGFQREDGEYKVMGMAPYGDSSKANFDHIIWWDESNKTYHCNDDYVWVKRTLRSRPDKVYSRKMVSEFGPEREGDGLTEPHIHYAAATQAKLEEIALKLLDTYLVDSLKKSGHLCFSGGCALNVSLNRRFIEHPLVKRLWVQPASHDAGGSLGAAAYVAASLGEKIEEMKHVYLGPQYSDSEIEKTLCGSGLRYKKSADICAETAQLLAKGKIVAWFQGRMEWGPRALGNRSILGNPSVRGTNDKINGIIKFRECWRPFCPSILDTFASQIIGSDHPSPFMTFAFKVSARWQDKIREAVHVDGTCRPQIVEKSTNPKYYSLIQAFHRLTEIPALINTSLNRRGEPMVCSPQDAMVMLKGSGLEYLAIGDWLVEK